MLVEGIGLSTSLPMVEKGSKNKVVDGADSTMLDIHVVPDLGMPRIKEGDEGIP